MAAMLGSELLAVQQGDCYWVHQDPLLKSKRITNSSGAVVSTIELDPWGGGPTAVTMKRFSRTSLAATNAEARLHIRPTD
jgi:hypothetical protein